MIINEMIAKAQEAYETSTMKHNRFRKFVQSYDWDEIRDYEEDGLVFRKWFGNDDEPFELSCDGLDPFNMAWKPEVTKGVDFYYSF